MEKIILLHDKETGIVLCKWGEQFVTWEYREGAFHFGHYFTPFFSTAYLAADALQQALDDYNIRVSKIKERGEE